MKISSSRSIQKLIGFLLIIALFFNMRIVHAQVADKLGRPPDIGSLKLINDPELAKKAKEQWDTLKYSDDVDALSRFSRQFDNTPYARKAKRRIKYLEILRERNEVLRKEQQTIIKPEPENSQISPTPFLISRHRTWSAYRLKASEKEATCYVAATPVSIVPDSGNHGDIFFMLTKYPGNQNMEPHLTVGYDFRTSSAVTVNIDGKIFTMFTRDNDAWIREISQEQAFLKAMKLSDEMELTGLRIDETPVKYSFSLDGMPAALAALSQCQ